MNKLFAFLLGGLLICSCRPSQDNALLLKGGKVVNAELGTVTEADVLIENGRIARIGQNLPDKGNAQVVDAAGLFITAGFIDSHVHIESSMVLPKAFGEAVLPHGTTAVIADPHEVVNVAGAKGLREFLDEAAKAPINVYTVVPSSVPATPFDTNGAGKFLASDMKEFVNRPEVVGLGEVMCYMDVVNRNPEIMDKIALFRQAGKTIDGHTAGMNEKFVASFHDAGVENDHECVNSISLMNRYRAGMNVYIREGSAARDAETLLNCVKDSALNVDKFAFCTDDKHLATIAQEGHISHIVRLARRMGFSWPQVARMASFNPSRYYHLNDRGNVAEGLVADLVLADDSCKTIAYVIKDGKLVAEAGKKTVCETDGKTPNESTEPETIKFENTVVMKNLTPEQFQLPQALQRVAIGLKDGMLLTDKIDLKPGEWKQTTRLATIERYGKNGNMAVCALTGYGIEGGAVATSVSHDSHNVVCAGDNEADMALACNRLQALGGGYVIASKGEIVGEFALPAYGLMSTLDATEAARQIKVLEDRTHAMGVNPHIDAFTTLSFIALPVIPRLRLLDTGLFDMFGNGFIGK